MNIVIQQENCYPPDAVFEKIQLCPGTADSYYVYSVAQTRGITGEDNIKGSTDLNQMKCPAAFVDTAPIPWLVDYKLDYSICTHRSWESSKTFGESFGLTLAYAVYAEIIV